MKTIKMKIKKILKSKIKDFIFHSTRGERLIFSELKRKIKFIKKQRRHTIFFTKTFLIF